MSNLHEFFRGIEEILLDQFQHGIGVFDLGIIAEGYSNRADWSAVNEVDIVSADMTPLPREATEVYVIRQTSYRPKGQFEFKLLL